METVKKKLDKLITFSVNLIKEILADKIQLFEFFENHYPEYYKLFDNVLDEFNKQAVTKISCGANCGSCCVALAYCMPIEAVHIWFHLNRKYFNISIDEVINMARNYENIELELQNKFPGNFDIQSKEYYKLKLSCPFLNSEQSCAIHNIRPVICRNHNVITLPELCTDVENIKNVKIWRHPSLMELDAKFQKIFSKYYLGNDKFGSIHSLILHYKDFNFN